MCVNSLIKHTLQSTYYLIKIHYKMDKSHLYSNRVHMGFQMDKEEGFYGFGERYKIPISMKVCYGLL